MEIPEWLIFIASQPLLFLLLSTGTIVTYGLISKWGKRIPGFFVFSMTVGSIYILIAPSLPKYAFQYKTEREYSRRSEFKAAYQSGSIVLSEPLTWFSSPSDLYYFVAPNHSGEPAWRVDDYWHEFYVEIRQFESPNRHQSVKAFCSDFTISISELRGDQMVMIKMYDEMEHLEREIYCETDYSYQTRVIGCKGPIIEKMLLEGKPDDEITDAIRALDNSCL